MRTTPVSPFTKPPDLPASNRPMLLRAKSYSLLRGVSWGKHETDTDDTRNRAHPSCAAPRLPRDSPHGLALIHWKDSP